MRGGAVHRHDTDDQAARPDDRARPKVDVAPGADLQRALAEGRPDALGRQGVAALQRAGGNAGVAQLLGRDDDEAAADGAGGASPVHEVVGRGGGAPLDPATRTDMEARFGEDFSSVRVHTDDRAGASATAVGASAYTVGDDVVFGAGAFDPAGDAGRRTIAHELTHVVQQRRGPVEGTPAPGGIQVSDPGDRFEREAESVASEVLRAPAPATEAIDAAPAADAAAPVQRQAEGEEEEEELPPV
jgi:hypothetical protein